jgi:hypothetical protein
MKEKKSATVAVGGLAKETSHKRHYSTSTAILQEACAYAAAGWPVLPVWGLRRDADGKLVCRCRRGAECERPGKHPKVRGGVHNATTDLGTIQGWNWQDANLAVVAGRTSGHVVLDVDARNGGLDSLAALQEQFGRLPPTQKVLTGDGWHLLFRYPAGVRLATRRLADGVDLLADGTCHIAPPSVHHSGRPYAWEPLLLDGQLPALPDLPDTWLEMLADGQPQRDLPPKSTKETKEHQRDQSTGGVGGLWFATHKLRSVRRYRRTTEHPASRTCWACCWKSTRPCWPVPYPQHPARDIGAYSSSYTA